MPYNPDIHHRRSIRLRGYDYALKGAYYVTICTHQRECLLGQVVEGEMVLSPAGEAVRSVWAALQEHYPQVIADAAVIMPNHMHAIILINDNDVGAGFPRPFPRPMTPVKPGGETPPLRVPTLGQIVGYFKYQTTKQVNITRDNPDTAVWQRNYYERILRNDEELDRVRRYIAENPLQWEMDAENPANNP